VDDLGCPDDEHILAIAEGQRSMAGSDEEHFAACATCRRVLAAAARGGGSTTRTDALRDAALPIDEPAWDELGQGVVVAHRYVLEEFLGAGGMGVVWRARRADDGARVALKLARAPDPDLWRRLQREAVVALALSHPNIVKTLEVLPPAARRGPGLVQELLEGETLAARLDRARSLPLGAACHVAAEVAAALAAMHGRGVVHRDLKPENVFLTRGAPARVVVLDLGIAKLTPDWGAHSKLTRSGAVLGSPRFMAPEQLHGEPDVDARADVWALGALLFHMLTGRAPIAAVTVGAAIRSLRGGLRDLAEDAPGLPADLVALARAALVIDRGARLASVEPFRSVLARYAEP
jgi:eukaryotic-like serine/threonine-protein kinase